MPSISQAKNIMRRTLSQIIDRDLTRAERQDLWHHFSSSCAFCDTRIERASRNGHIDHLESDGGNGPRNRVLACATCNGDEKREQDWHSFLNQKCPDNATRERRQLRIESWTAKHPARGSELAPDVEAALRDAQLVVEQFHTACSRLRQAVTTARRKL